MGKQAKYESKKSKKFTRPIPHHYLKTSISENFFQSEIEKTVAPYENIPYFVI